MTVSLARGLASLARNVVFVVAALAGVAAGGASAQQAPGVNDSEIMFGTPMPLTGPVRLVSQPYEFGLRSALREINDAGGIYGRRINFVTEDDAYQPARSLGIAKKMIERDNIFAILGCFGTPNCSAVMNYTEEKQIPMLTYTSGSPSASATSAPKYTFGLSASYGDVAETLVKQFAEKMGLKKIGFLYQNDDLGENARKGLDRGLQEVGLKLTVDAGYERTTTDFATHILRLRDANPDAVVAMGTAPALGAAIKKANEIGFKTIWGTYLIGESEILTKLVGDGIDGLVYASDTESRYSTSDTAEKARAIIKKYYPDAAIDLLTIQGYAQGKMLGQALQAAGKNLTRENFVKALRNTDFDVGVMRISYKNGKQTGADALKVYQWSNGTPKQQSDWVSIKQAR